MEAQHTQGPWAVEKSRDSYWVGRASGRGDGSIDRFVCQLPRVSGALVLTTPVENAANARLIAAAPALVEALKEVREACFYAEDDGAIGVTTEPTIDSDLFERICAALSQALGGE